MLYFASKCKIFGMLVFKAHVNKWKCSPIPEEARTGNECSVVHRITLVLHMICEVVDLPVFTDELYLIEEMCKCYLRLAEVFCI